MADQKLTALTADTSPTSDDLVYTVNDPSGTPASRQSTAANFITKAHGLSDGVMKVASSVMTVAVQGTDYYKPGGTDVAVADGGTNLSSYAVGDVLYASGATTLSKLADTATGNALISGGVTTAPAYGKIGLTTHVSGTLPVANGGTGTGTALTSGSVVLAGGSGIYTQDATNLVWDAGNANLRIGPTSATITTENRLSVIGNANDYHGTFTQNKSAGALASTDIVAANDVGGANDYVDLGVNSSGNTNASFTLFGASDAYLFTGPGGALNNINIATGTTGKVIKFGVGGLLTANEVARFTATGLTVGLAGTTLGAIALSGNTSGTTTLQPAAAASGTLTLPSATDTVVARATTDTLTNKRITARVGTTTSSATPTINTDNVDAYSLTAQAAAITSMTTNLSGTPTNFQKLTIRIKDDGTARGITWGTGFEAKGVALPTTTVISKVLTVGFIYDTVTSKWGCVASAQEA